MGVFELVMWDSNMVEALRTRNHQMLIEAAARQETFRPLILSGLDLASQGVTTISEVMRIMGDAGSDALSEMFPGK